MFWAIALLEAIRSLLLATAAARFCCLIAWRCC
jgi:hypothetical protein